MPPQLRRNMPSAHPFSLMQHFSWFWSRLIGWWRWSLLVWTLNCVLLLLLQEAFNLHCPVAENWWGASFITCDVLERNSGGQLMLHPLEALHHFFDPNTRAAGFRPDGTTKTAGTPLFFNPIYWHSVCVQVITPLPPSLFFLYLCLPQRYALITLI